MNFNLSMKLDGFEHIFVYVNMSNLPWKVYYNYISCEFAPYELTELKY